MPATCSQLYVSFCQRVRHLQRHNPFQPRGGCGAVPGAHLTPTSPSEDAPSRALSPHGRVFLQVQPANLRQRGDFINLPIRAPVSMSCRRALTVRDALNDDVRRAARR